MFGPSNDELSPPSTSELLPGMASTDVTELEDALKEISREISCEFSCAREADPSSSSGQNLQGAPGVDTRFTTGRLVKDVGKANQLF